MSLLGEAMKDLFPKKDAAKALQAEKDKLAKQMADLEKKEQDAEKKEIRSVKVPVPTKSALDSLPSPTYEQPRVEPQIQIEDIIVATYNKQMEIDATLKEMQEALILLLKK